MRTTFRCIAWVFTLAVALPGCERGAGSPSSPDDLAPPSIAITKGPYLQSPGATTMTIMWETSRETRCGLLYGTSPAPAWEFDEPQAVQIHEILLSDLAPDTRYYYSVSVPGGPGRAIRRGGSFVTAPASTSPFTFAAYGDSQANPDVHRAVAQGIAAAAPAFVVHTGDMVWNGLDHARWGREFFAPCAELMCTTPYLTTLGNHENDSYWYYAYFAPPAARSGSSTEAWCSYDYGCAHIIILDSQQDLSPAGEQYRWLRADLGSESAVKAAWRIVSMHQPVFTSSLHGPDLVAREYLVPLFEAYRVNLVLSGHEHAYQRSEKEQVTYIVSGGAGGTLYPVNRAPNPFQRYAASAYNFVIYTVSDARIEGEARDIACTPFDTFVIEPWRER